MKALPPAATGLTAAAYLASRPTLADLPTPLLTLDAGRLAHNTAAMAGWCAAHGVDLCPHGKTTMAPALWLAQLRAGAWGITVANEFQLRVARSFGVPRVHVANSLLRAGGVRWLAAELARDPGWQVSSWVDSVEAVEGVSAALTDHGTAGGGSRLAVCVELGAPGARTGARSVAEAVEVAGAVRAAPGLRLVGVAGYEGAVVHAGEPAVPAVDRYLHALAELHRRLGGSYDTAPGEPALVTVGGSAWFDRVVEHLAPLADPAGRRGRPVRVLLRSGAYVVHDDAHYREITPSVRSAGPELRSAMHGWARVLSRPEPGLAILDAGRRDLPFDQDLPIPQLVRGATGTGGDPVGGGAGSGTGSGTGSTVALADARVTALDDQHAYVALPPDAPVRVGDVVRLGLSHPCTAFDKWTLIPVLDDVDADRPAVTGLVRTFF